MLQDIPRKPGGKAFQQGSTPGAGASTRRRARFFLFFRFHARSRVIVLGWVNDTDTNMEQAPASFMVASGHPPDDWEELSDRLGRRL